MKPWAFSDRLQNYVFSLKHHNFFNIFRAEMLKISRNILRVKYWERSNLSLCETIFAIHRDYFKIYCGKVGTLFGSELAGERRYGDGWGGSGVACPDTWGVPQKHSSYVTLVCTCKITVEFTSELYLTIPHRLSVHRYERTGSVVLTNKHAIYCYAVYLADQTTKI